MNSFCCRGAAVAAVVGLLVFAAASPLTQGASQGAPGKAAPATPAAARLTPGASPSAPAQAVTRTRAEVEALIQKAGATPPDWWASVPLTVPPAVDLTWPDMRGKPWNPQTNIGQYMWSVINENAPKWREGVKLLHHCLMVNKNNPAALQKTMDGLGNAYFDLLQDWPRAVFWWRKAGYGDDVYSARCYWKMGCKEMAVEVLNDLPETEAGYGNIAKLWADMGETDRALAVAEGVVRAGRPEAGYLAAGDACRQAGRYVKAVEYYQKLFNMTKNKNIKARAQDGIDAIRLVEGLDLAKVRDGTYTASTMAYAGPLEIQVTVRAGRIADCRVTKHQEKQYYTSIADTPAQIVAKQGIKGVDAVSSATITSEAIMKATVKALAKGMQ
jgi:uncharacterized protein with FMN-binding domain